jgi:putative transposase
MGFSRTSHRYRSRAAAQAELRLRIKELALVRVRYGYRRLHVLLRREGWSVNHKRVYRLYMEEGLAIRRKTPKRKRSCRYRGERTEPVARNDTWAMDFMSDRLFDNRAYRILTILDCHSRESLATEPRQSFRAANVVDVLDRLIREHGKPKTIRCDNGPEFAGRVLDQWAFYNRIELDFSRPATPTDNAYIESFNARLRQELLNASWFALLAEASAGLEAWKRGQTAHGATEPDTQRVHRGSASGLKSRITAGPETGARPLVRAPLARALGPPWREQVRRARSLSPR